MIEERERQRKEMEDLYNAPANLRLKYIAWAVGAAIVALFMIMIFWIDDIPPRVLLFMRGCAGLGAVIFVILVAILVYRVNSSYIRHRKSSKK